MAAPGRVVMLQGTASHAGKTLLAAALCRMYARRGHRVAPFKAQNMALNSFVTEEGGEMGRAQAYQARAAGLEPRVDMNPVLLKPSSDATSQVVVMGRPVGHMTVREYHAYQAEVWPVVTSALERLRASHDLVVIEGAGSSAEVNLRGQDIVNMRLALHARSPVLLVGDIDRGGVFASLLGHVELFTPEERGLVAGFVINKFRGDARQLESGVAILRERTGVPTLGVVPFLEGWSGDEEDSVALDDGRRRERPDAPLRIAVLRLPYLSNSTDVDVLAVEPDVDVRFVRSPDELAGAAAVVLPGTKSTIADLAWLRRRGLADAVRAAAAAGTPVIGICGGYQMLGRRILDPERIESQVPAVDGLGLLDTVTTFAAGKRTVRADGELLGSTVGSLAADHGHPSAGPLGPAGTPVCGYEIHMGRTELGSGATPLLRLRGAGASEHLDGASAGVVCGTYLHGLFDHPELSAAFLNGLRAARGLASRPASLPRADDLDRLADHVEAHLDTAAFDTIVWS
jgi:adenosylcobyric acid synthase